MSNSNYHWNQLDLDAVIRTVLFPLSVVFAVAALSLAVRTYSDLQQTSISSALATVQSVDEAFNLELEYPQSVVLSSADRHFERFWVVSDSGIVLASNDRSLTGQPVDAGIWKLTEANVDGTILSEYSSEGRSFMMAGSLSASGDRWTIVQLSPPFSFTTAIWLILAILAMSLMSVCGLIAVRFIEAAKTSRISAEPDGEGTSRQKASMRVDMSNWKIGSDGQPHLGDAPPAESPSLHEAVLQATDDYVIVLDKDRNLVFSNPIIHLSETEILSGFDGLTAFSNRYLDDRARTRFDKWLADGTGSRKLIMDVRGRDGLTYPTSWKSHFMEMQSGTSFEVLVGHRMVIEEFPEPTI